MNNQPIFLTQKGFDSLKAELEDLLNTKLPQAVERVSRAREFGDLSENSEYHAAREDHAWIQGRIEELTDIVSRAQVVNNNGTNQVAIGCSVTVTVNGGSHEFHIVGEWEADPAAKKISHKSPLGEALIGKKVGESIEVDAPAGKIKYTIAEIK